ncbi:MAG: GAF and ANTAR domain-containing protein [Actinomycetes bacterium]
MSDSSAMHDSETLLVRSLAALLLTEPSMSAALHRAAVLIAADLPGADAVSVTLADGERRTIAFSGDLAAQADEAQYDAETGPCLDAIRTEDVVLVDDLEVEQRWPQYRRHGLAAGVRSSFSLPLYSEGIPVGALNIYSRSVGAFDQQARDRATVIAGFAGVVLVNAELYYATAERADQMREAMASRAVIEQAKGVLMARQGCDADTAFFLLVRMSQASHRKLRDVAADLVAETTRL